MTDMGLAARISGLALLGLLVGACQKLPEGEQPQVHWILHSRNATTEPIRYWASEPNVNYPNGFVLFNRGVREPGLGILLHSATIGQLPRQIRYHWTAGADEGGRDGARDGDGSRHSAVTHWRFDAIHPYELIPPDIIKHASSRTDGPPPPLLVRITFLPEGRLRFSWHACADTTCKERGSPSLRFTASHEFQGRAVDEPPPVRGF